MKAAKFVLQLAILVGLFSATFNTLFAVLQVEQQSMDPTLADGQYLIVWRAPYLPLVGELFGGPQRGDIVVFLEPGGRRPFIKRVIGLPGETVEGHGNRIYVNGQFFEEPYLPGRIRTNEFTGSAVLPGYVFVMGDNRPVSLDSRQFGPIKRSSISGVAIFSFMPLDRFGTFPDPFSPPQEPTQPPRK